jgi:hypothetical protein
MKSKRPLLTLSLLVATLAVSASAASKPMFTYYLPWYVAQPYSATWGWHWTMGHFDPEVLDATGQRQVASWYRPLIGPYDSADPIVLEYHVLLMKLSGIDGVIVDWYGAEDYLDYAINNARTLAICRLAGKAGLQFALCYEDQTVRQQVDGGHLAAEDAIAHAQQTMLYLQRQYFSDPAYLRLDSRPVLLNFGPQYFKENAQWEAILAVLDPTNRPAFFTEDRRLPVGEGAFNWPPMWLSLAPGTRGVLSMTALQNYLEGFEKTAADWPAFISSAFPRFHDIYQSAGVRDYWGYLGDRQGQILRQTLSRALTNSSALVQIVTWNDFGEGTMVEPTVEYGFRDLGILQELRREHLDGGFNYSTNDLLLPLRLYQLRRVAETNLTLDPAMRGIFDHIVSGNLPAARSRLTQAESVAGIADPAASPIPR